MSTFLSELARRRTFAIIAHPDAGKTTLTEKLLLFGGAIQTAGAVKSNKIKKSTVSDFMEIERQRGISVSTSVMGFEYRDLQINILDTPGHEDFAEDTYRTLTAVDSAIVVIDVANGVEKQTEKLTKVCRMRNTPIIFFINKLDREGRTPSICSTRSNKSSPSKCARCPGPSAWASASRACIICTKKNWCCSIRTANRRTKRSLCSRTWLIPTWITNRGRKRRPRTARRGET